ncbi:MAG: glutathione ABC transporter permease GsiC [Telmatospirillum sp.]|nr:glutathione ABC transporter permease GsiC [Telmatospirillum sp.]
MLSYLGRRLAAVIPVLLAVSLLVFLFVHLLPGDPARLLAGPDATPSDIAGVRADLGLDRPLAEQYVRFLSHAVTGDLGLSIKTRTPVAEVIAERFWPTVVLTLAAMAWSTAAGLLLGVVAAIRRGRWPDHLGMILAVSGISFPAFWLGLLMIDLFSVRLHWLPTGGYDGWRSVVMPSIALGRGVAAVMARFTRSAVLDISREDYVRTARAKGVMERGVIWRHILRNALIPVITMAGLQFGFLLGGSIVVEIVFSWPGLGRLLVDSVSYRDYPVLQAEILLFSLEFILINLAVDILYAAANPEIRYR